MTIENRKNKQEQLRSVSGVPLVGELVMLGQIPTRRSRREVRAAANASELKTSDSRPLSRLDQVQRLVEETKTGNSDGSAQFPKPDAQLDLRGIDTMSYPVPQAIIPYSSLD